MYKVTYKRGMYKDVKNVCVIDIWLIGELVGSLVENFE